MRKAMSGVSKNNGSDKTVQSCFWVLAHGNAKKDNG